jgi:predicted house-cleaning NTP pyrophosphatase (Maf/HAM1 superfamily)
MNAPVLLASFDPSAARVLTEEAIPHEVVSAPIDEGVVWHGLQDAGSEEIAAGLARSRARIASRENPGALILAVETVLTRPDGSLAGLPVDAWTIVQDLRAMAGGTTRMVVVGLLSRDNEILLRCTETILLTVPPLSEAQIQAFAKRHGDALIDQGGHWTASPAVGLVATEGEDSAPRAVPAAMLNHLRHVPA